MSQKRPPQRPRRSSRISSSSCPRRGLEPSGVVVEMRPTPSTTWARNTRWTCVVAHMTTARRRCAPTRNDTTSPTTPCTQSKWFFFCLFLECFNLNCSLSLLADLIVPVMICYIGVYGPSTRQPRRRWGISTLTWSRFHAFRRMRTALIHLGQQGNSRALYVVLIF